MNNSEKKEIMYVLGLAVLSLWLYQLIWWWPLILILPAVVTYTVNGAGSYILLMAVIGELFAVSPPGILALAVALPWLAYSVATKMGRDLKVDISLKFLGLVLLIAAAQQLIMMAPLMWEASSFGVWPWWLVPQLLGASALIFTIAVWSHYNRTW